MSAAYNGLASFGRFIAEIKFGLAAFFGALMLIVGILLMVRSKKLSKDQASQQKKSGMIFIGAGVFMAVGAGISYKLAQTYKPVAAINGVANILNFHR